MDWMIDRLMDWLLLIKWSSHCRNEPSACSLLIIDWVTKVKNVFLQKEWKKLLFLSFLYALIFII